MPDSKSDECTCEAKDMHFGRCCKATRKHPLHVAPTVAPGVIAISAWKLRMVLYDEDGAPVAERMPETDELQAALQALHNAELTGAVRSNGQLGG